MPINIQDYLLGRIPVGRKIDIPAYLMSKAASGSIQEVTGTLPLTVRSRASQILKNYRIYGTESGAGVETENGYKLPITVTSNGTTTDYPVYIGDSQLGEEEYVDYESGKVYKRTENLWKNNSIKTEISGVTIESSSSEIYVSSNGSSGAISANSVVWGTNMVSSDLVGNYSFTYWIEGQHSSMAMGFYKMDNTIIFTSGKDNTSFSFEADGSKYYVGFYFPKKWVGNIIIKIMLVEVSTAPSIYIPYLQPTDPPAPLPDITLPQGEVTIDTEEELKPQATIKGEIKQI